MENQTLKQLREIAKPKGIPGWYKLNKAPLIAAIMEVELRIGGTIDELVSGVQAPVATIERVSYNNLLDEQVPDIQAPVLAPSYVGVARAAINSFADWLLEYVPEKIKKPVNEKLKKLKSKVNKAFKKYGLRDPVEFKLTKSALNKTDKDYTAEGIAKYDPESFLKLAKNGAIKTINANIPGKFYIVLECVMKRIVDGVEIIDTGFFRSKNFDVLAATNVNDSYDTVVGEILEHFDTFTNRGSGWIFVSVTKMVIHTDVFKPLKGSSYIPLPTELTTKKAIINIKNEEDNECFKWCVTLALNPVKKNAERLTTTLRDQASKLDWSGVEFPMNLKQITKFEKNNVNACIDEDNKKKGVSVNVYGYENKSIYPLCVSEHAGDECKHQVDLLFIAKDFNNHFCLIKNLSRLLSSQTSSREHERKYCRRCLYSFDNDKSLENHQKFCSNHKAVLIEMSESGATQSFTNYNRSMRVPFIVTADFESILKKIDTCQQDPNSSHTNKTHEHVPVSFCYKVVCFDNSIYSQDSVKFTAKTEDDDVAQIFVDKLIENIKQIYNQFRFPKKMICNDEDWINYNSSNECHICGGALNDDRVRDHCHFSGKFRGAAHNSCNQNYKIPKFFPVVFHNFTGYDSHFIVTKMGGGKINCIPSNEEKYISFSREIVVDEFVSKTTGKQVQVKRELRFIDSFRFMPASLDTLSKNLTKDQCKILAKSYSGEKLNLLLRKGVYPYEWVDSISKFNETQLPPIEAFYSSLNNTDISEEDYRHAQAVWKEFGCETFRDYHNLYNETDVLLLADVFENFRDVCMTNYRLDPAWYYTSPGLAWDAALKLTNIKLELLSDYDMILMIKHGTRGGVSMISNRLAKANNKYMGDAYDPNQESKYIQYLDANNLYGWAMCKPLPTHGFKWMDDGELENWKSMPCILEVDMDYPKELHDLHNDYPLAPENMLINGVDKLVPNLNDKKNYVVHYENLKLYENLGLKITKIHRGIKFEERDWLRKYIDLNTNLRTKATNDFEKDFFKLMNNSVFGKTMENIENRVDIKLVTNERDALKLIAKPNFDRRTIFNENLVAFHMKKTKLVYNKPIYLGMCILDLSKTLMYDFHYNYIKPKYDDRAKLVLTDTDSLIYVIETDDFYADIAGDVESRFDTSGYPNNHPAIGVGFQVGMNKKVPGMFKEETGGKQIEEIVGLRPKLYSFTILNESEEHKKCKGVKKNVVEQSIVHNDYMICLLTGQEELRPMNVFRTHGHTIYTEVVNKIALSANDDKRVIMEDGINTLAYGHWRLG